MYFAKMKKATLILVIVLSIGMTACTHRGHGQAKLTHEDSVRIISDLAFKSTLLELQKVREDFSGPIVDGDEPVTTGDKFKTYLLDDSTKVITGKIEKLESQLEHAQKDSTTDYGALLTRFKLLKTQHKYMTATYNDGAHLLRFTTEVTFDDKHEEDRDFYFNKGVLVYFRERHTYPQDEQDISTDDSYFLVNGRVVYSYRDLGTAQIRKDKMDYMASVKRYHLKGDVTSHVAKEFGDFKQEYEMLLVQQLEPLIYPSEQHAQ